MTKIVYRVTSGNVVGVVERADMIDYAKSLGEQYQVKIGVLDRRGPLPRSDAQVVIKKLQRFVMKHCPPSKENRV